MFAIVGIFREHPEANMDRKDFVSKKQAARVLGVAFRTVDRICTKNQVRVWQLPNHSRRLYNKADLMAMLSVADLGAAVSAVSV